jgi:hypothetical protein
MRNFRFFMNYFWITSQSLQGLGGKIALLGHNDKSESFTSMGREFRFTLWQGQE